MNAASEMKGESTYSRISAQVIRLKARQSIRLLVMCIHHCCPSFYQYRIVQPQHARDSRRRRLKTCSLMPNAHGGQHGRSESQWSQSTQAANDLHTRSISWPIAPAWWPQPSPICHPHPRNGDPLVAQRCPHQSWQLQNDQYQTPLR